MIINFVGNFNNGYVGELGDANHLVKSLEELGHTVHKIPQDVWKAICDFEWQDSWSQHLPKKADINIICKWHHFNEDKYIDTLRKDSGAPVFYWVWDFMQNEDWHLRMVKASDLYLGNDVRSGEYPVYLKDKLYYFPFDVADGDIPQIFLPKDIDVAFFGSWIGQGDRQEWLKEINKTTPITAFSWNHQDWPAPFHAEPAVYGEEFNRMVARTKIVLGFSVEPSTWGYWSNRVGKVLLAGGFLLYQYAPGMELFLRDGAEYFSTIEEAQEKIDHYLIAETERNTIAQKGFKIADERFSSKARVKDLTILIERYLKTHEGWKY